MYQERLFTPGPVEIPDRVREALGRQIIHHRTEEFRRAFLEVRELLKRLLDDPSENFVFFSSSGTGAMEAAILNFFEEGDKVLVVNGGKFGERWLLLAKHWGLEVVEYRLDWGKSADPEKVKELLKKYPDCKGVLLQISETSTGSYHPIEEIAEVCKDTGALLVADAITALGVYNLKPSVGIDVLVGGSQKALMLPPGLSLLWFSQKAKERLKDRAFYFSVKKELGKQQEGQTAWTPAISLLLALKESLGLLLQEGMDRVEKRYRAMSEGTKRAMSAFGLEVFPERPAISITAVRSDDAERIRKELLRHGIRIAGGQDHLKGKIFRVSHMGVSEKDMLMLIGVMEVVLKRLGYPVELGNGVSKYSQTLVEFGLW
ncbi:Serine-pyruvate aminotransferase [bacterium HR13]|nr:Serine-pyruvate aminotransferase [bacterium HR13]